jgi:hypothetical protein
MLVLMFWLSCGLSCGLSCWLSCGLSCWLRMACVLQELVRRLSKSAAMRKVQALEQTVAGAEKQLQGLTGDAKEVRSERTCSCLSV